MTNKLCAKLSRYSKTIDGNIKYLLGEVFDKFNVTEFKSISRDDDISDVELETSDGRKVFLTINSSKVYLTNPFKNYIEEYIITSAGDVFITTFEKRSKGVIISEIKKEYHDSKEERNEKINTNFDVKRYGLSYKKINEVLPNFSLSSFSPINLEKFTLFYRENVKYMIDSIADYKFNYNSYLVTHYYNLFNSRLSATADPSGMHLFINGEDFSSYYESIEEKNKLDIIYDVFMGNINESDIETLLLINIGLMSDSAYDLYGKLGYKEVEDSHVGGSLIKKSQEYRFSTKKLLAQNYKMPLFINLEVRENIAELLKYGTLTTEGIQRGLKLK